MEIKSFTAPFRAEWWVGASEPKPEQQSLVSVLHIRLHLGDKQIEISRLLTEEAVHEMDDQEVEALIITEVISRMYPRERKF